MDRMISEIYLTTVVPYSRAPEEALRLYLVIFP